MVPSTSATRPGQKEQKTAMSDDNRILERLRSCQELAKARSVERNKPADDHASGTGPTARGESTTSQDKARQARRQGVTSSKRVSRAAREIFRQEQMGLFTSVPIQPSNEYPTLLARLPLFPPTTTAVQKALLDKDNALPFSTCFGTGRRFGAMLTIQDEDVLQATARLRTYRLQGKGSLLPIKIQQIFERGADGQYEVHSSTFTLKQLCDELGWTKCGKNYRVALQSLRRLNSVVVELEVAKKERYFGSLATRGAGFKLLDVAWDLYREEGIVYVQFNPLVVMWLEKEFTYINWNVRRRLRSPTARALHRFLSSQPAVYRKELLAVANAVGIWQEPRRLTSVVVPALEELVAIGWLESYAIEGTGRSTPKVLTTVRLKKAHDT